MAPKKTKKPPGPTLEQEAKEFLTKKVVNKPPVAVPYTDAPCNRELLAASVLSGLLAQGGSTRAEELVEEAFRYADLILKYK